MRLHNPTPNHHMERCLPLSVPAALVRPSTLRSTSLIPRLEGMPQHGRAEEQA